MSAVLPLCALALRPVLGAALKAVGAEEAADSINGAVAFLTDRFTDQSRRLPEALDRAGKWAWRCLEIALAGESLWTILDRAEDRAFRDQVRALLRAGNFPALKDESRRRCLAELRAARKAGSLTAKGVSAADLARQTAAFARFAQPTALIDAEWHALAGIGAALRQAGYATLAKLVALRPAQSAGAPLLAVAVRYFFRREVEGDPELFRGLSLERLDQLSHAQEAGFAALAVAGKEQLDRLDTALSSLGEIRGDVRAIRSETEQLNRKFDAVLKEVRQGATPPRPLPPQEPKPASAPAAFALWNAFTSIFSPQGPGGAAVATAVSAPPRPTVDAPVTFTHQDLYEIQIRREDDPFRLTAAIELDIPANKDR